MREPTGDPGSALGLRVGRATTIALAGLLAALLATAAQAQLGPARNPGQTTGVDTPYTPIAKEAPEGLWTQVAGAKYNPAREVPTSDDLLKESPTPVDVRLHAVSFRESERGFAGGTLKKGGETIPALYRHTEGNGWQEDPSFTADGKGFVAALAWIDDERALAVGGDGDYPDRERHDGTSSCAAGEGPPIGEDQAGKARVWLYETGRGWRELRNLPDGAAGDQVPDAMGGLTALDFFLPDPANPIEFGMAGGLCQIWHWWDGGFLRGSDGEFKAPYSHQSPVEDVTPDPTSLRFRIRSITFAKPTQDLPPAQRRIRAHAVTSGCCSTSTATGVGTPVELSYESQNAEGQWRITASAMPPPRPAPPARPGAPPDPPGSPPDPLDTPDPPDWPPDSSPTPPNNWISPLNRHLSSVTGPWTDWVRPWTEYVTPDASPWQSYAAAWMQYLDRYAADVAQNKPTTWSPTPDSYVSVTATQTGFITSPPARAGPVMAGPGIVATPAGPQSASEPPSHVGGRSVGLIGARLVDGDGDTGGAERGMGDRKIDDPVRSGGLGIADIPPLATVGPDGRLSNLTDFALPANPLRIGGETPGLPDGIPDWSIGSLSDTGQALAYATDPAQVPPPNSAVEAPPPMGVCYLGTGIGVDPAGFTACQGEQAGIFAGGLGKQLEGPSAGEISGRAVAATPSYKLMKLPSYRLNAIDVLDGEDIGWAVGDHGAILRLKVDRSRAASRAGDPDPPQLGAREAAAVPDGDQWGDAATGGDPRIVPRITTQKRRRDEEPKLHLEGSIDTAGSEVRQLVMSRSGDEGWALLQAPGSTTLPMDLAHYDGEGWTYCDPRISLEDMLVRPGCTSVAELREMGVTISQIERIPLERDPDPGNDDGLELVGLGGPDGVVRYRNGRWQLESPEALKGLENGKISQPKGVAFTAPNHGWILSNHPGSGSYDSNPQRFYRFDGSRWINCWTNANPGVQKDNCDPHGRLPRNERMGAISSLHAAGDRVYAMGTRMVGPSSGDCVSLVDVACRFARQPMPLILYRHGGENGWAGAPRAGEYDPGAAPTPDAAESGTLKSLSIVRRPDGIYEGWATGSRMLAMKSDSPWKPFHDRAAVHDYGMGHVTALGERGPGTPRALMIAPGGSTDKARGQILFFNEERARWEILRTDRAPKQNLLNTVGLTGTIGALAPDGSGGFWAALADGSFYRYTDRPREPVFREMPQPSERMGARALMALAAGPGGTIWAASSDQTLYRFDRRLGWDAVRVPGWEAGRVITAPSPGFAIALNRNGDGLVVGRRGRIAEISGEQVTLDPAAGTRCTGAAIPPCGTGNDLNAVDVAADGSAVAVGDSRSILWRPPGGHLRAIAPPIVAPGTSFTGAAIARHDRIWLITQSGRAYSGKPAASGEWQWMLETERGTQLRAIALDEHGRGYAVGSDGLILERSLDGKWRSIDSPTRATLMSVALPASGGEGAIIGGAGGVILTRAGERFEAARQRVTGWGGAEDVVALVLLAGARDGAVEAWAATRGSAATTPGRGIGRLLRHRSDPPGTALDPVPGVRPLPDAPALRNGELALAAFGKMDCRQAQVVNERCYEIPNANDYVNAIASRITDELGERSRGTHGPDFALFTGDAVDVGGYTGAQVTKSTMNRNIPTDGLVDGFLTQSGRGPEKFKRWGEAIADDLTDRGVPLVAAPGAQDLAETRGCELAVGNCASANEAVRGNENLAWRQAMRRRSRPWGSGPQLDAKRLRFRRVRDPFTSQRAANLAEAGKDEPEFAVPTGGAPTHYAIDVYDDSRSQREVARIVVVDSSFGSLSASDPVQQPLEPDGGQAAWLEKMLCIQGMPGVAHSCSRKPHQRAIVVSNAPTYSYGPGAGTHTAADGAAFEAILMKNRADLVVSGRIGWNGRYWATAPGVHEPCPGGSYPTEPPEPGSVACGQGAADLPTGAATNHPATAGLAATLGQTAEPAATAAEPLADSVTGLLPFVVASGAGGKFADENGEAKDGFWHGYTIVRLDPSGDPRKTIVEQRPVYDWIGIEAAERILRPGQRLRLRGFGRGPIGIERNRGPLARYDRIDGPALTHRYDLVEADPERRWLPRKGADGEYVALDPSVATVDTHTGQVRAGRGNHPRAHAVAILSMGCVGYSKDCDASRLGQHVATYPLIFEPRRTFAPTAQAPSPRTPSVIVQSAAAGIAPPGSPGAPPQVGSLSPPALPSFPSVQPPPATPPIGHPTPTPPPPPPPAPPPPAPLGISAAPPGLTVAPPAAVIPPPAPPINPAPPGGARKEARQRQAATEKSGSDAGAQTDSDHAEVDSGANPPGAHGAAMTRRDRTKAEPSFTTVARPTQPSAWARGAVYGGGLTLMALAAAGLWTARPRPKPRPPIAPAPAWSPTRRR